VVIEGYSGEVGISKLVIRDIGTVNLELELVVIVEDGESTSLRGSEILHGVVEVELLDLVARRDRLLDLGDEHVLGLGSEHLTLLGIEVRVVRIDIPLVGSRSGTPSDTELNIVVLEGDEGEGGLPVLTEGKAEGVEPVVGATRGEVPRNRLRGSSRRKGRGDESRVGGILFIDDLTTDEEFHLGNLVHPIRGAVSSSGGTTVGDEVHIAEHITLALEADGGHAVVRDVALNDLTLGSLGKVSMTLIGRPEKAHLRVANEVHILGTDSYELGNTTRHFII